MGQFEDVLKAGQELEEQAAPAAASFEDILAAGQQLEQPAADEPFVRFQDRPITPTTPEEARKQRLLLEVGGGIAASLATGPVGAAGARVAGPALRAAVPAIARAAPTIARVAKTIPGVPSALKIGKTGLFATGAGLGEAAGSFAAESIDPSESPIASARGAFLTGALSEAGGRFLLGGLSTLFGPKELVEGAQQAFRVINAKSGTLTPGRATKSWAQDLVENALEASFIGGKRVRDASETAVDIAGGAAIEFANTFSKNASPADIGAALQLARQGGTDAWRAAGETMAIALDTAIGGARVDNKLVFKAAEKRLKRARAGAQTGPARGLLEEILGKDRFTSFADAQELRSTLLAIGRKPNVDPGLVSVAEELVGVVDNAMEASARALEGPAFDVWRGFNKMWKDGHEKFNNPFMKRLAKLKPEAAFQTLVRGKSPTDITLARTAIDDEKVWKLFQGGLVRELLFNTRTAEVSGAMGRINAFGDAALDAATSPAQRKTLRSLARTLQIAEAKRATGSTPGGMIMQFTQAGAIMGLVTNTLTSESTAALTIPWFAAHVMMQPDVARWISLGIKAPPGSAAAVRSFAQIAGVMVREGIRTERETERERRPRTATFGGPRVVDQPPPAPPSP
ncbi:MAG: hypothetical protein V3S55_07845 [Nitrospiraceae bacterium]